MLSIPIRDVESGAEFQIDALSSGEKGLILTFLLIAQSVEDYGVPIGVTPKATRCSMRAGKDGPCSIATISRSLAPYLSSKSYSLMTRLVPPTWKRSAGVKASVVSTAMKRVSLTGSPIARTFSDAGSANRIID